MMNENTIADVVPAGVTAELIAATVTEARRWHYLVPAMYTLSAALAAGWRGQPMRTVCRPARNGVGGDYWMEWDGGGIRQRSRSCADGAGAILDALWDEFDRQKADEKEAADAARRAAEQAAAEQAAAEEAEWRARRAAELAELRGKTGRHARQRRAELRWYSA